jgi:general secretion pathway protein F
MPHFSYRAIGRDGKTRSGVIEADGLELASRQLRGQGFTLLKLEAGGERDARAARAAGKPPGRQEILSMTSELAVLLRAGMPLDRALKVLIDMASLPQMQQLLAELLTAVKGGKALSHAMAPHEALFGNFYISMVRSGEASGQLSSVLDRLV